MYIIQLQNIIYQHVPHGKHGVSISTNDLAANIAEVYSLDTVHSQSLIICFLAFTNLAAYLCQYDQYKELDQNIPPA